MSIVRYSAWSAYWVALAVGAVSGEAPRAGDSGRTSPAVAPSPVPSSDAAPRVPVADSSVSGRALAPAAPGSAALVAAGPALPDSTRSPSGGPVSDDSLAILKAQIARLQAYLAHSLRVSSDAKHCPVPLAIGGRPVSKPWTLAHERAASRDVSPTANRSFQAAARHNVIGTAAFFAGAVLSTVGPALASRPGGKDGAVALLFPAGLLLEGAGFLELFYGNRLRTRGYIQYDRDLRARYRIDDPVLAIGAASR